ncbi:hypothetical protein Syun_004482 [Stephania yunnanensis]|uniref:Uncharacterized protein n=1 Tax=Stephania yunnanensis TaxID=152371 RepID=A0AAP0L425_9MAGN
MKYNPSTNWVHELSGEFGRMFTLEWKSLEAKWSEKEKSDLVYKDQGLMEISKRKLPPKLHVIKDLKNNNTNPKCESLLPRDLEILSRPIQKVHLAIRNLIAAMTMLSLEASSGVECPKTCEGQLSPSKSLHAAMSKSRFADTILKAQQKTLSTGERVDPLKVKQEERERFD